MSFRSRPRATQPTPPRQRTLSSSRTPSTYYSGNTGYSSRPLSTGYYTGSQPSVYQSPYAHTYGSRDNLFNHSSRNGYYSNGAYDSRYKTNPFGSDRYMSPYSSFDKGVTTAGLSLSMPGKGYVQKPSTYSNKSKNSNKNDFNSGRDTNLIKGKSLSASNTNLNSYPIAAKISVGTNTPTSLVVRSQSLRDQERKSRSRSRNRSAEARSLSASSEKSEGYESGSERTARLRVDSTPSLYDTEQGDNKSTGKDAENGDVIDYKALWEAGKVENDKLRKELKKKDDELTNAKASMEKYTNTTTKNSLSELEKRERRAMERKLSEMEEELKHLDILKSENQRLKEENGALIRVISKLSK